MLKKLLLIGSLLTTIVYGTSIKTAPIKPTLPPEMQGVELPTPPDKTTKEELESGWRLEKNYTAILESKMNVFVPLEILSDIDINAIIIDSEDLNIPFDIELNKEPDRKNYYKLKFSETEIDIDNDGKIDTFIYSPKYINQKIVSENYVNIKGANISKDGDYYKKIYITIEVDE